MGDYTTNNKKQEVKIGTCGAGYYSTFNQLKALRTPSEDAKDYLSQNSFCAFPFPDYDKKQCGEISQFHSGERVEFPVYMPEGIEVYHSTVQVEVKGRHNAPKKIMNVDCPDTGKHSSILFLDWQIKKEGILYPMAVCPYCGQMSYFNNDEVKKIVEYNTEDAKKEFQYKSNTLDKSIKEQAQKEYEYKLEVYKRMEVTTFNQ